MTGILLWKPGIDIVCIDDTDNIDFTKCALQRPKKNEVYRLRDILLGSIPFSIEQVVVVRVVEQEWSSVDTGQYIPHAKR